MTWVVSVEARYANVQDAANAFEPMVIGELDAEVIRVTYSYGPRSTYGAVRPASEVLHEVFDPVAEDDHYRAWPDSVTVTVTAHWQA